MTSPTRGEKCPAVLRHGPGHQSQTSCHRSGPHQVHETVYGGLDQVARWRGPEATTGFFDDAPADFPELDRPPTMTAPTHEEVLERLGQLRKAVGVPSWEEDLDRAIAYLEAEEGLLGAAVEVYESIEEPDRHAVAIRRLGQELAERGLE